MSNRVTYERSEIDEHPPVERGDIIIVKRNLVGRGALLNGNKLIVVANGLSGEKQLVDFEDGRLLEFPVELCYQVLTRGSTITIEIGEGYL